MLGNIEIARCVIGCAIADFRREIELAHKSRIEAAIVRVDYKLRDLTGAAECERVERRVASVAIEAKALAGETDGDVARRAVMRRCGFSVEREQAQAICRAVKRRYRPT